MWYVCTKYTGLVEWGSRIFENHYPRLNWIKVVCDNIVWRQKISPLFGLPSHRETWIISVICSWWSKLLSPTRPLFSDSWQSVMGLHELQCFSHWAVPSSRHLPWRLDWPTPAGSAWGLSPAPCGKKEHRHSGGKWWLLPDKKGYLQRIAKCSMAFLEPEVSYSL